MEHVTKKLYSINEVGLLQAT